MQELRVSQLIAQLSEVLARGDIADPRAEARDIIAALLHTSRFWPTANGHATISEDVASRAVTAAGRRTRGEPFAYAVGQAAFRHLTLSVDRRVLIPRQETEMLVEIVLAELRGTPGGTAVDVGTGSGAIALALAQESLLARIIATDISEDALAVAAANFEASRSQLRAMVEFRQGVSLGPVAGERVRAVVANPPYIAHDELDELPGSVRDWEPPLALFSDDGGMAATATLISQASSVLEEGGLLAIEIDSRRAGRALALAEADGTYRGARIHADLTGRDRVLTARRSPNSG